MAGRLPTPLPSADRNAACQTGEGPSISTAHAHCPLASPLHHWWRSFEDGGNSRGDGVGQSSNLELEHILRSESGGEGVREGHAGTSQARRSGSARTNNTFTYLIPLAALFLSLSFASCPQRCGGQLWLLTGSSRAHCLCVVCAQFICFALCPSLEWSWNVSSAPRIVPLGVELPRNEPRT